MYQRTYSEIRGALQHLLERWGVFYVFGAEVQPEKFPRAIDCSELIERAFNDALHIPMPDGSYNQLDFCRRMGRQVLFPEEKVQPLDLAFLWTSPPDGGQRTGDGGQGTPPQPLSAVRICHVAAVFGEVIPVGQELLIEARGRPFNHVIFTPLRRFREGFGPRFAGVWRVVEAT